MRRAWFHEHLGPMGHKFGRGMGRACMMGGWRGPGRARRGDIKFLILDVLAEGPRHGYDIISALEEKSQGRYRPSPGSVYPTLTMLEEGAYITGDTADGTTRSSRSPIADANCSRKSRPTQAAGEDDGIDLRGSTMTLGAAVVQAARASDAASQVKVREILDTARREIYKILAESE